MKTQRQISREIKISETHISLILHGQRRPSWKIAKKLAMATKTKPILWIDGTTDQMRKYIGKAV